MSATIKASHALRPKTGSGRSNTGSALCPDISEPGMSELEVDEGIALPLCNDNEPQHGAPGADQ